MAMDFSVIDMLIIIIGLNHHLNLTTRLDSFRLGTTFYFEDYKSFMVETLICEEDLE